MKKHKIFYLIGLIIIISCAKDIIDLTGSIDGVVKDCVTSEPLQGVSITLSPSGKSATTGNDGRYSFPELDAGNYSIEFSKFGYEANKKEVTILAGKPMQVDAMLNKIKNGLIVNPITLNFGDLETSKSIFISCIENLDNIRYTIKGNADWISLSATEGSASSAGNKITVVIDRSNLSVGEYEKEITISSLYGEVIIPIAVNQVERNKATVVTDIPNNITETSLTIKGTIVKTGGLKITSHGHCWAETEQPTIDNNKNNLGDTEIVGDFTSTLTNLTAGKTYYIRAYAVNSKGVAYSEQVSVTLPIISKPTVVTRDISNLKKDSVCLNGVIIDKGNGCINEFGFYWGLTEKTENKQIVRTVIESTFSYILKSLQADKTYYYKAYAINEKGESTGEIKTFTSFNKNYIDGAPTIYTEDATEITIGRATLKGYISDSGDSEIIQKGFYYGESESTMVKKSVNTTDNIFTLNITDLKDDTKYYYKAFAVNKKGETCGELKSFKTNKCNLPVVITSDATNITINSATLNALIIKQEDSKISKCGFYYGESVNSMIKKDSNINDSIISLNITDLKNEKTYYYKAFATNQKGESCGDIKEFTTRVAKTPEVQTLDATDINIESATLNGEIISNGDYEITQRGFYFGTSKDDMTKRIVSNTDNNISLNVTNLADGTTYYYKVFATNQKGETCGDIKEFTTKVAKTPEVQTLGATDINIESATLNGEIISNGDYEITQRGFYFGASEDAMTKKVVNTTNNTISLNVTSLTDGTTYYYKVFATNQKGETCGDIKSFSTHTANSPTVLTGDAECISFESVVLYGEIIEKGTYDITQRGFYFGKSENSMSKKYVNTNDTRFNLSISDLNDGTKYYYKAFAINDKGESCGELRIFTTKEGYTAAIETKEATNITIDGATLNAIITDEGSHKVTERGFYFGTSEISMNRMIVSTSNFSISLPISNLSSSTTYYFKSFAVNKKGESLGEVKVFTTLTPKEPNVQTNNATNISYEKATLNGAVLDEGTYNVTEYGFYFGTNQNPTVKYQVGNSYNTTMFYKSIANLNDNTTYYYKAYAKNSIGYSFGEVKRFTTIMKPKISIIDYSFSKNKQSPTSRCDIKIEAEIEVNDATIIEQGILSGRSGSNSEISLNSYYSKVQCEIINNRIVGVIDGSKHISYGSYNPIRAYIICDDGTIFYSEQIIAYTPKYSDL